MPRAGMVGDLASLEERILTQATEQERALVDSLDTASQRPTDSNPRRQKIANELLARGDRDTIDSVVSYGPFMSQSERDAANRRSERAGIGPLFSPRSGDA